MPTKLAICLLGAAALLMCPAVAGAGTSDALVRIAPRPPGSRIVALASDYGGNGLIYSDDDGETFTVQCGLTMQELYKDSRGDDRVMTPTTLMKVIVTHDDHVIVADSRGLWMDDGHGCGWRRLPELRDQFISDIEHDPRDPSVIYGVSASGTHPNSLFRRNADGSIEELGTDEHVLIHDLEIAALPDGGLRFYEVVGREQVLVDFETGMIVDPADAGTLPANLGTRAFYVLRFSDDFGASWTSYEYGPEFGGGELHLEAIDPTNPDRLILSLQRWGPGGVTEPDVLLVSDDRGETREPWHEVAAVGGVAFEPDGTVWIGDRTESTAGDPRGLWRAASAADAPVLVNGDYAVWCLEPRNDRIEVCEREAYGLADRASGELTRTITFTTIDAVHTCEDADVAAICEQSFCTGRCKHFHQAPFCIEEYNAELNAESTYCSSVPPVTTPPPAGGASGGVAVEQDANVEQDAGSTSATSASCDCHAVTGSTPGSGTLASIVFAAALVLLRTRRHAASRMITRPLK